MCIITNINNNPLYMGGKNNTLNYLMNCPESQDDGILL